VKYGGLTEEEALKLVTINPARQLKVDSHVGSLEPGKDADFVIWSGSPLSVYSHCEQTWIDGRKYFDREEDHRLYEEGQRQRAVLVQKALQTKKAPGPVPGPERPGGVDDQDNRGYGSVGREEQR
jgi:adenine deaminase